MCSVLRKSYGKKPEKAMATHSSTLAWKIPRTEEPGRLQSLGSQRVGYDWATSLHSSMLLKHLTDKELNILSSVLSSAIAT